MTPGSQYCTIGDLGQRQSPMTAPTPERIQLSLQAAECGTARSLRRYEGGNGTLYPPRRARGTVDLVLPAELGLLPKSSDADIKCKRRCQMSL